VDKNERRSTVRYFPGVRSSDARPSRQKRIAANVHDGRAVSPRYFACHYCDLHEICADVSRRSNNSGLATVIEHPRPYHRGDYLFRQGDPVRYFYVVNSGITKQFITTSDGTEQVVNFTLTGESVSLDYLEGGHHNSNVMALDTTSVCAIPVSRLNGHKDLKAVVAGHLLQFATTEIARKHELQQLIGQGSAENKLAYFIMDMASRLERTGHPAENVILQMSRHDIANYLCLADETVSRLFSKFSEWRILNVDKKQVQIVDFDTLRTLAYTRRTGLCESA
jgi:CRP/FNR family transcriptional regulator